jgi:Holliday junction DNA helicase RuvA
MFEFFRGKLYSSTNNSAVVDVNGVGYKLGITLNTFAKLPEINEELTLFAYYHVTENSQSLFGFFTQEERKLFIILIGVNKIGPKVALSILSTLSVEQVATAVENQDSNPFKAVSGVGPKTAQRLVLELKGKLNIPTTPISSKGVTENPIQQPIKDEAYTGLIALGYAEAQVRVALTRVEEVVSEDATVQEWITTALKVI